MKGLTAKALLLTAVLALALSSPVLAASVLKGTPIPGTAPCFALKSQPSGFWFYCELRRGVNRYAIHLGADGARKRISLPGGHWRGGSNEQVASDGSLLVVGRTRVLRVRPGGVVASLADLPVTERIQELQADERRRTWYAVNTPTGSVLRRLSESGQKDLEVALKDPFGHKWTDFQFGGETGDGGMWAVVDGTWAWKISDAGEVAVSLEIPGATRSSYLPCLTTDGGELLIRSNQAHWQRLSPSGAFTPLPWDGPSGGSGPYCRDTARSPDGSYWFVTGIIHRATLGGAFASFSIPQRFRVVRVPKYSNEIPEVVTGPLASGWVSPFYGTLRIAPAGQTFSYTARSADGRHRGLLRVWAGSGNQLVGSIGRYSAPLGYFLFKVGAQDTGTRVK